MDHIPDFQLNEYLDNALGDAPRAGIDEHLRICAECRARLGELQSVFSLLSELPESHLERDLRPNIVNRLRQKESLRFNPVLAAQLGTVLGSIIWLAISVSSQIKIPAISIYQFLPSVSVSAQISNPLSVLPNVDTQSLFRFITFGVPGLISDLLKTRFELPGLTLLPHSFPGYPSPLSIVQIPPFIVLILFLWVSGNAYLLHRARQVRK